MAHDPQLVLSQEDFQKLSALLAGMNSEAAELLEEELGRAAIVPGEQLPTDVVAMNTTVCFKDQDDGKESVVTLVYPHEADIEKNKISILSPIGSALIGLRAGQSIQWPLPNGKERNLKVVRVDKF